MNIFKSFLNVFVNVFSIQLNNSLFNFINIEKILIENVLSKSN